MSIEEPALPSRTRAWFWVFALVLAYICSYVDRQILSLMVDPIRDDLAITDSQFGLLHGLSFAMLYCVLGIPLGSLVDRYPRRYVISAGVLVWSVMTAICGLAGKFWQLFVARIGVGVGEAALSPGAYSLLSDSFPRERLGLAISVYTTGAGLGAGLAYIVGGWLYAALDAMGSHSLPIIGQVETWQTVFFIVAIPGIPIAILIHSLSEPERQGRVAQVAPPIRNVLAFMGERGRFMACFLLGMSAITGGTMAVMAWAPSILVRSYGMGQGQTGLMLGLVTMVCFPGGLLLGAWFARQIDRRGYANAELKVCAVSAALAIPAAIGLALASSLSETLAMTGITMVFTNMSFGIAGAKLQAITPNEMRGRISAIYLFTVNFFGMTLGPLLPGLWTDYILGGDGQKVAQSISATIILLSAIGATLLFSALSMKSTPERSRQAG